MYSSPSSASSANANLQIPSRTSSLAHSPANPPPLVQGGPTFVRPDPPFALRDDGRFPRASDLVDPPEPALDRARRFVSGRCFKLVDRMGLNYGSWPFRRITVAVPCEKSSTTTAATPSDPLADVPDLSPLFEQGEPPAADADPKLCKQTQMTSVGVGLTGVYRKTERLVPCDELTGRGRRETDDVATSLAADPSGSHDVNAQAVELDDGPQPGQPEAGDAAIHDVDKRAVNSRPLCNVFVDGFVGTGRRPPQVIVNRVPCGPENPDGLCRTMSIHGVGGGMLGFHRVVLGKLESCETIRAKPNEVVVRI